MSKLVILLSALLLAACSDGAKFVTRDEVEDIADDVAAERTLQLEARIADLEEKLGETQRDISGVRALGLENARNADGLQDQVNGNAGIANDNALADMTKEGRCGYTQVAGPAGGAIYKPIQCTRKDLAK